MSLFTCYKKCFVNYANFKGRASRKEYWGFVLLNTIIAAILGFVSGFANAFLNEPSSLLYALPNIYTFIAILPGFAVYVRRLHDLDKSGWSWLWCLTIIGAIPVLIWTCKKGTEGENKYGSAEQGAEDGGFKRQYFVLVAFAAAVGFALSSLWQEMDETRQDNKTLIAIAKKANESFPVMASPGIRVDSANVLPGKKFVNNYTFTEITAGELEIDLNALKFNLIDSIRTADKFEYFRKNKVTMVYIYRDKNGEEIAKLELSYKDYGNYDAEKNLEDVLISMAKDANKEFPVMASEDILVDSANVLPGKKFVNNYTFINNTADELNLDLSVLREELINETRTVEEFEFFRKNKVTMVYVYRDKNGEEIARIELAYDDYK